MKKAMSLVTALTICALQCPSIASAQEDDYSAYFADKSEINCVAIGGSITAAGGVSASGGSKVSTWLGEKTGKKVNFYNAGIGGTGSDFGITRLYDDVVSRDPDIVFVEFSVNDRAIYNESATDASGEADTEIVFNADLGKYVLPTDADGNEYLIYNGKKYTYTLNEGKRAVVKRDMEAITRQLLALPKRPVIIYNYVGFGENHIANTSSDDNRIGRLVMPRACIDVHEEIAEKYGIPSINIDSYIQNIMVNGAAALDGNTYKTLAQAQKAGASTINYGLFVTGLLNFIIMAFVIFMIVKAMNKLREKTEKPVEEKTTKKICPYCQSEISIQATRCPHCTSQLEK